ncbi:MAG: DUF2207 domain-containing protein [Patescibacteria group bacterium]
MHLHRVAYALAVALAVAVPSIVSAGEVIRDFSVAATVSPERLLRVTETVTYDFGDEERHGIYRYVPTKYVRDGVRYDYRLKVVEVTMDGEPATYESTGGSDQLYVKIGDADVTVTGTHLYAITYQTDRAIGFFDDHAELYWNVTGNDWTIPIEQSDFSLALPVDVPVSDIRTACFTGVYGSTEADCTATASTRSVSFVAMRALDAEEGFTVVIGIPNGIIQAPSSQEKLLMFLSDNFFVFIPLVALFLMWFQWRRKGRDPKLGTVIPLYEPPRGLLPAELACARDDNGVPSRAITATIIDLARRGHLHIRYEGKAYTFVKTVPKETLEPSAGERALLKGLFENGDEVSIDDLQKNKFYKDVSSARSAIVMRIKDLGVFVKNPGLVRTTYIGLGCGSFFILTFLLMTTPFGWVAAILTGLIVVVVGWFMPARTEDGVRLLAEIKGFEWFMTVTEKDRLAFHNAPAKTPEKFMELLPYAIALGVETEWAKQFEGIDLPKPEWAEGQGWSSNLGAVALASSLHSLDSKAAMSGYSAPSSAGSGGSGFSGGGSGGGGGGGGGGSW